MKSNLTAIADILTGDGFTATVEYPGCVVVSVDDDSWWFGTANGTWQGDLNDHEANYLGETLDTGIAGDETDAAVIAQAIARVLNGHGFVVVSPDDLPITPDLYPTREAAERALAAWCARFARQGYYAAASGERISLTDLSLRCRITES